ncbi:MAG: CcoQ/FixQ family Cbb3-type cytochrome c oxidase assembly chaperone [Rhizobiaceae bacterium]|nr:CcoQ/FixQ family Cbb3-type cytochrome c oxidase assembly chaperone [Rhizobiaceae bacterium]
MSEWFVTLVLQGWLVIAFALFAAILAFTFWPGSRARWERNGRLPFEEADTDGRS